MRAKAIEVCMLVSECVVSFDTIYLKLTCIERKVVLMNKYKNTSWVLEETLENRKTEIHGSRNKMFLKNYKFTKDLKSLGKIFILFWGSNSMEKLMEMQFASFNNDNSWPQNLNQVILYWNWIYIFSISIFSSFPNPVIKPW